MPDDEGKVQVVVKDENLWCTQKAMAQLFGVKVPAISKHLTFRRYALLSDIGRVTREQADRKAEEEYRLFDPPNR